MTAPQARTFTVGQVITVLVGDRDRVFCSWGELLEVLGWLWQDVPLTEGVDDAIKLARPHVAEQHPELADVKRPAAGASDTAVLAWLHDLEAVHGRALELAPIEEVTP